MHNSQHKAGTHHISYLPFHTCTCTELMLLIPFGLMEFLQIIATCLPFKLDSLLTVDGGVADGD